MPPARPTRAPRWPLLGALLVAGWPAALPASVPRGLLDHAICCGPKPSMNAEDFVEVGYDPMRRRQHLAQTPAETPAAPTEAAAPVQIPGSDSFAAETPSASAVPIDLSASAAPPRPLVMPTEKIDGHLRVGFDVLGGYPFKLLKEQAVASVDQEPAIAAQALAQIPALVRQLDGQKVLLTGYMLPMKMEGTLATEFLLVANSMLCCYGLVPDMNQWVVVKMAKGVKPQQDVPVQFFGTLRVQPRFDAGALSAIYHLDGDRARVAK